MVRRMHIPTKTGDDARRNRGPTVRLSDAEDARIKAAATRHNYPNATTWMREVCMAAVAESEQAAGLTADQVLAGVTKPEPLELAKGKGKKATKRRAAR